MKKEDIRYLIMFIILILLIGLFWLYNDYRERDINVNRKINYIYHNYTYDTALKESKRLFQNSLAILNINNYEYKMTNENKYELYNINGQDDYKKILSFDLIFHTFTEDDVDKFMENFGIVEEEKEFYIQETSMKTNKDYVGSIIDVFNYDKDYLYLKSDNYYCENGQFSGLLSEKPTCDYIYTSTTFKLKEENGNLRIADYEEILQIIK